MSWDYTSWLNIVALLVAAVLLVRFLRTGGREMMQMMGGDPDGHDHGPAAHGHEAHGAHCGPEQQPTLRQGADGQHNDHHADHKAWQSAGQDSAPGSEN